MAIDDGLRSAVSAAFGCDVAIHAVPVGYAFAVPQGIEDEGLYAVRREAGLWRIEDSGTFVPSLVAEGRLNPGRHAELLSILDEVGLSFDYDAMTVSSPDVGIDELGPFAVALSNALQAACSRFRRPASPDVLLALAERFSEESGPDAELDTQTWMALGLYGDLPSEKADQIGVLVAKNSELALGVATFGIGPGQPSSVPALSSSIDAAVTTAMRLGLEETSAGEWLDRAVISMRSDGFDPVWSNPDDIARVLTNLLLKDLAGARSSN